MVGVRLGRPAPRRGGWSDVPAADVVVGWHAFGMRNCAACGAANPDSARFCGDCGASLDAGCPACGTPAEPGKRFCMNCGSPLPETVSQPGAPAAAPAGPSAAAPVAERRVCSVLFADLVGFTPLSEHRDPEQVRELLSRYFEVARQVIGRYGGVVEKFIGDAVMAVWGTPAADEGDTERAVRAALELVAAVGVLGSQIDAPGLAARAGVVTGEVAVTIGATGEGMVAGDAVNTAARVQAAAEAGTVLVDEATRRLAQRAIAFADTGTHELKGKEAPERLFRVLRVLSGMGGKQRADGLEAPFTGRDVELRGVKDLFHASVERRSPRLVVVSGPAGVGKSRLGWEFEKYIDGIADTVLWHRGRCLSYGEGVTFWALAEIVRQRFGIAEEDAQDVAAGRLHEGMVRYVPDPAEREYVGMRLSRLLGVPYASESRIVLSTEELFAGWRLFFERLAQIAPVVMLVEDAQHADEGLLAFFEHLVDWTRDLPIFVALFARPGLEALDSGFAMGRNRSSLTLDPLDDASMATLVDSLVPGMPDGARDAITARAQGIPLFAVETIRSLIDHGVVERDGDSYRLAGTLGDLSVPDTLHALLAGRLDALPPDVRVIAADASVLGQSFPKDAVVAVSGADALAVDAALAELVRRDVLQVSADPLSPERGAYHFSQEMLRQVAYETLSKRDRKTRHLAVARHLRGAFANDGEEIADAIARHYLDALAAGPDDPDAEEIGAVALDFLVRAAERAEQAGALGRAADGYAAAAAIAPPERVGELYERASKTSDDHDASARAVVHAEAAIAHHDAQGDRRGAARSRVLKAVAMTGTGRFDAAREELEKALEVLRDDPDTDTVVALHSYARILVFTGNLAEGVRVITEALELAQALDVGSRQLAPLFSLKGIASTMTNRGAEGVASFEMAARLAEEAGDYARFAIAQLNLSNEFASKDPVRAERAARSAVEHSRRTGVRRILGAAGANLAVALMEQGRWNEADEVMRQVLEEDHVEDPTAHWVVGLLASLRGDARHAEASLESATAKGIEEIQMRSSIDLLVAAIAVCEGDHASALDHAMKVMASGAELGVSFETLRWGWPLATRSARRLGRTDALDELAGILDAHPVGHVPPVLRAERRLLDGLRAADVHDPRADELLDAAVAALREVGHPYQLAHALADVTEIRARQGDIPAELLDEVEGIARQLDCPALSERARDVARAFVPVAAR
jgi:class 3 adenylate cyclase/tetratricopeptide (TPR) repeat protein